jgi:hypothetical protein
MQVALSDRRIVVPAAAEESAVAVDEAREGIRDAIDQRCGQRSSAHTLTRRIDARTSPSQFRNVLEANWVGMQVGRQAKRQDRAVRTARGFAVAVRMR